MYVVTQLSRLGIAFIYHSTIRGHFEQKTSNLVQYMRMQSSYDACNFDL